MGIPTRHQVEKSGERRAAGDEVGERDRALRPIAGQIRLQFIHAYRRHHLERTGQPSDFGSRLEPRWDGGKGRRGGRRRAIWYDVAGLALAERVEPYELIEAAFSVASEGCLPQPPSLLSPAVVARARADRGVIVETFRNALHVQYSTWQIHSDHYREDRGCDLDTAARATLRNRRLELSSVFRYCTATHGEDPETAREFEDGAVAQYVRQRWAYDRAWGDFIPAALKERADRALPEA